MEQICMNVGDWSGDGHERNEEVDFHSSHPVSALKDAYKASVRLTGVTFDGEETWGGADNPIKICTDYEESEIPKEAAAILERFGYDFGDDYDRYDYSCDPKKIAELILWFIGLSLINFEYEITVSPRKTYLNGLWDKDLNVGFGYGIFL